MTAPHSQPPPTNYRARSSPRMPWPGLLGGRLDKTGTHANDGPRGEAVGKPSVAGVYTNQRLNLSKLGKAFGRKPRFQTGPGKSGRPGVRPEKTGVFSRRQACRGKSQVPCSLDSRVAGNQNPEAYRQGLPWGDHESPGRNDSERKCGLERPDPRAEPASVGRRQNGVPKSDRCGIATSAG